MASGRVIWRGHPSYKSKFMAGLVGRTVTGAVILGGIVVGLHKLAQRPGKLPVIEVLGGPLGIVIAVAVVIACLASLHVIRKSYVYTLSTFEASMKWGIVNPREKSAPYSRVQTVELQRTWYESLILKTGDVVFATAATDAAMDDVIFRGVDDPKKIIALANQAQYGGFDDAPARPQPAAYTPAPASYESSVRPTGFGDGLSDHHSTPAAGERPAPPGLPPR